MSEQQIVISENGPHLVSGSVLLARQAPVVSEHGEPLAWKTPEPIETKDRYALCRCGGSENKPLCDGSHKEIGFSG